MFDPLEKCKASNTRSNLSMVYDMMRKIPNIYITMVLSTRKIANFTVPYVFVHCSQSCRRRMFFACILCQRD